MEWAESWLAGGLAALGLIVGSFLNVVIVRVPEGSSIARPGSRCPKCGHSLRWYENIPVLSWLVLRGRCSQCKQPISLRYPAIELTTSILFLACLRRFDWTWQLASALVFVCLLIVLTFIDLEHWILPFEITVPGAFAGIALALPQGLSSARDAAIGALTGFIGFWILEVVGAKLFRKEALGGGDKGLLALLGAYLTYRPLLGVVFLASLQGALIGSILLLVRGRAGPQYNPLDSGGQSGERNGASAPISGQPDEDNWRPGPTSFPFGPWLAIAGIEVLLLGPVFGRILPPSLQPLLSFG